MGSGEIAIVAALIGAGSALIAQWSAFILTRKRETSSLKKKLISEERSLAFLIYASLQELATHDVCINYEYRIAVIFADKPEGKESHERHYKFEEKAHETQNKVNTHLAEYFKTVSHFTALTGDNSLIEDELNKIRNFVPASPSLFPDITSYDKLINEMVAEKDRLKKDYQFYSICFNRINREMKRKIN
jgi:hypothetical protein